MAREPQSAAKTRRDLNGEATRRNMVRSARRLFARQGYAGTSLDQVVRAAKVTTGALYHHFGDKKGLFQAVAEAVEADILERILAAAAAASDPWARLIAGTTEMLSVCAEPAIQRIAFQDAPTVIGAAQWRAIEMRFAFGVFSQALEGLMAAGVLRRYPADMLAPVLLGATIEAATAVARADDKPAAQAQALEILTRLYEALRITPPPGGAPHRGSK